MKGTLDGARIRVRKKEKEKRDFQFFGIIIPSPPPSVPQYSTTKITHGYYYRKNTK